jgi:hypothetical protein
MSYGGKKLSKKLKGKEREENYLERITRNQISCNEGKVTQFGDPNFSFASQF